MSTKPTQTDRDVFFETLRLYDRPERELRQRVLDERDDIDGFIERAFSAATTPPSPA